MILALWIRNIFYKVRLKDSNIKVIKDTVHIRP